VKNRPLGLGPEKIRDDDPKVEKMGRVLPRRADQGNGGTAGKALKEARLPRSSSSGFRGGGGREIERREAHLRSFLEKGVIAC